MPFAIHDVRDQGASLKKIGDLIAKGSVDPSVVRAARAIVRDCDARDDRCEVEAVFEAVKNGTDAVPGLARGLRYVSDPRVMDYFASAPAILREAAAGAAAGDCDEHTILVAALLGALGYKVGARAWGPNPKQNEFAHVYPIVALPKRGPWPKGYAGHGLDTTVPKSHVGWQPPKGRVLTVWIEEG